jgi:endonuclease YncB( thermonuclease family)
MRRPYWDRRAPFRGPFGLVIALLVIGVVALAAAFLQPQGKPVTGRPDVVDGDTLRFGSLRVRLLAIDAPELDQSCTDANGTEWACGVKARAFVVGLVRNRTATCARAGRDRYGRALAKCEVDGTDIGRAIVEAGWAVAEADYAAFAAGARIAKRGIWEGQFDDPAEWRRNHGNERSGLWEWIRAWFQ